ncbi:hypothetical protein CVT25_012402 [Psilocybe cyanescens]|uniref:Cytochrome P450 monooxygenase pc-3 n=1 Tax=Psilocybe cyanescens TaxID=93625 RepID=A0A409X7Q8_PSICY|nr:hypothetical protein CVT25_012402 [Psilocybe cyanescens]
MDVIPPGILYLLQRAHRLAAPPALAYLTLRYYLAPVYGLQHPALHSAWMLAGALLGSLPSALALAVLWDGVYVRVDAARRGAVMPPSLGDWTPGNIASLVRNIRGFEDKYPGDGFDQLVRKIGGCTFNERVLFENRIATAEPDHIKAILATQFDEFEKGPETRSLFYPLLGTGVFAADGELWKERISHFDNFDRHAEDAISLLKTRFREGHPVDFQDLVARFTLDSATEFLLGNDVESLSGGLPYPYYVDAAPKDIEVHEHLASRFVSALPKAQMITARRLGLGVHWPLAEFWHDKLREPMRIVHEFIDPIVAEAIRNKELKGELKEKDDETLLESLVNSTEDPITLRDEIMSLLVAGRDTTASTLTFIVYMLAEHPEALRRLREEVLEKVGAQRRPTYDDFRDMKYLRAVINETLRLYPAVPFNIRTSKEATTWPNKDGKPFYIPANTRTPYAISLMQRRKDLWGPDALEFDPDRFLDERLHKYLTPNPFIFLPFNAGPRICLGQQFAYHETSFFLVRLLQHFSDISLASDAQPPKSRPPASWAEDKGNERKMREKIKPKAHLTMYVQDGLWVTMKEA